jgi:hypothetical protein
MLIITGTIIRIKFHVKNKRNNKRGEDVHVC